MNSKRRIENKKISEEYQSGPVAVFNYFSFPVKNKNSLKIPLVRHRSCFSVQFA